MDAHVLRNRLATVLVGVSSLAVCLILPQAGYADPNWGGWGGNAQKCAVVDCGSSNNQRNQNSEYRERVERENQAIGQYNDGIDALRAGNLPLAEAYFRQALAIRPGYVRAQTSLALAYGWEAYKNKNYALALSYYEQIQQIDPQNGFAPRFIAKVHAAMARDEGNAAWKRDDPTTALASFRQAYTLDPHQEDLDAINTVQKYLKTQHQAALARQQTAQSVSSLAAAVASAQSDSRMHSSSLDFKTGDDSTSPGANHANGGIKIGELGFMDSNSVLIDAVADSPSETKTKVGAFHTRIADPNFPPETTRIEGSDRRADDQVMSAADRRALKENAHGHLNDIFDKGGATRVGSMQRPPDFVRDNSLDPSTFTEKQKNAPGMQEALTNLSDLQKQRSDIEADLRKLTDERNRATPEKMPELNKKIAEKETTHQVILVATSSAEEKVKKIKREVDTEVGAAPTPANAKKK